MIFFNFNNHRNFDQDYYKINYVIVIYNINVIPRLTYMYNSYAQLFQSNEGASNNHRMIANARLSLRYRIAYSGVH